MRLSSGAKFSGFLMPLISWQLAQPFSTHQSLAVFDLLGSGGIEMHIGDEVGLRLRLQEAGQRGHLLGVEAVVRHHGFRIVVIGICHPILQPLRFRLRTDARQFRPDVTSDHHASGVLHGMA